MMPSYALFSQSAPLVEEREASPRSIAEPVAPEPAPAPAPKPEPAPSPASVASTCFEAALQSAKAGHDVSWKASPTKAKAKFKLLPDIGRSPESSPKRGGAEGSPAQRPWTTLRPTSPVSAKLPLVPLTMTSDSTANSLGTFDDMCDALKPAVALPRVRSAPNSPATGIGAPSAPSHLKAARGALGAL